MNQPMNHPMNPAMSSAKIARQTQVMVAARRTEVLSRGGLDSADVLNGAVKAFNQRQAGRSYDHSAADNLFAAVKAFNTRRLG
jgi:hypothetical protein